MKKLEGADASNEANAIGQHNEAWVIRHMMNLSWSCAVLHFAG